MGCGILGIIPNHPRTHGKHYLPLLLSEVMGEPPAHTWETRVKYDPELRTFRTTRAHMGNTRNRE